MPEIETCLCDYPSPGPLYWDWRCRRCSGRIPSGTFKRRWARRLRRLVNR